MKEEIESMGHLGDFPTKMDKLRRLKTSTKGEIEYWFARELQEEFGYDKWDNFVSVIEKARENCAKIGANPKNHFAETKKMIDIGKGGQRAIQDFVLSKVGCHFVALNADSGKAEIAWAKAYFIVQTRIQENKQAVSAAEERLRLRNQLKEQNRLLGGAAKGAGVENFAFFHDAGIRALYGMQMSELRVRKGVGPKDDYWDRAGSLELSANEFKAQLVRESLVKNGIKGQAQAESEHKRVARVVRDTVHAETGKYLEEIPLEPSLKKLLKAAKKTPSSNDLLASSSEPAQQ
jgi:DNA-damage-inducible protein D